MLFINNKGRVGKTTQVYHIAWMLAEQGQKVLAVDLDPQANLSSMLLPDEKLEEIWPDDGPHDSILASIEPILDGTGDFQPARVWDITDDLHLIVGDLGMSGFEDRLSENWPKCLGGDKAAFRGMTAFYRIMIRAAEEKGAEVLLIDIGPNLGAINRAALIAAEYIVMPLAQEARKPIFLLKPADGAIGAHAQSVSKCYVDFKKLTQSILEHTSS